MTFGVRPSAMACGKRRRDEEMENVCERVCEMMYEMMYDLLQQRPRSFLRIYMRRPPPCRDSCIVRHYIWFQSLLCFHAHQHSFRLFSSIRLSRFAIDIYDDVVEKTGGGDTFSHAPSEHCVGSSYVALSSPCLNDGQ